MTMTMMMNKLSHVFRFKTLVINRSFCSSALYITGDKAQSNFVVLKPFIDFDEQLKNKSDLLKNLQARQLNIDLDKVEKRWDFYKMIEDNKYVLELTRNHILKRISELKEDSDKNKEEIEKLTLHIKLVRDELKIVKEYAYGIEENANLSVLKLPNVLHPRTPLDTLSVIHEFKEKPTHKSPSHLEIGTNNNLLEYTNPMFYFLQNDAALLEFAITNYFQSCLLDFDFTQFSNADFVRSIVIEGCGEFDFLKNPKVFTLEHSHNEKIHDISKMHLVGGASLYSFMAYFSKHSLQPNLLPLKLFSIGRNYKPTTETQNSGLFNVSQESVVSLFVALQDDSVILDEMLNNLTENVVKLYEGFSDYHFRVIYLPANQLSVSESLRVSIQMFSNHLQDYVEIGNLSVYDNYLSKRLLFIYKEENEQKFCKIIAGNLMSVQKFIGCALENISEQTNKTSLLSDMLQKHL